MSFADYFHAVYSKRDLTLEQAREAALEITNEEWQPEYIAAFLTALHMKGETSEELAGIASAMLTRAVPLHLPFEETMDTCGTGGDQKGTFNISTVTAFVLAACGIPVTKHGNRAASSQCGSADLLHQLGVRYRLKPAEILESLERTRFAFLFAPDYHPATRTVAPVRKLLAAPTVFNLIGPLTNPARPRAQLLGVYDAAAAALLAQALRRLRPEARFAVVHGNGWDEATPCAGFQIYSHSGTQSSAHARDYSIPSCSSDHLRGGTPEENARIAMGVLSGEQNAARDTVVLNAVIGYQVYHPDTDTKEATVQVSEAIDSGGALQVLRLLQRHFPEAG